MIDSFDSFIQNKAPEKLDRRISCKYAFERVQGREDELFVSCVLLPFINTVNEWIVKS